MNIFKKRALDGATSQTQSRCHVACSRSHASLNPESHNSRQMQKVDINKM
jgi:hypothetical protein